MTALLELGADVVSTDAAAAAEARAHSAPGRGRLGELAEWLAGAQGRFPADPPDRVRCIVLGGPDARVCTPAEAAGIGIRSLDLPADPAAAFSVGTTTADAEAEGGTQLLIVAAHDPGIAPAVVVGALTGAEPVALLPRGAAATDSAAWVARAVRIRDARRTIGSLRNRPDEMLAALASPVLSAAAGCLLRAAGRRTAVLVDGTAAVAAALLCVDIQPRAGAWWQVADTSPDPVHRRAVEQLGTPPVLDLGTSAGDGTAGVLAVPILRAAAST